MSNSSFATAGVAAPSAARFLRGLFARSVFLLSAVAGLNLIVDPMGAHGSRVFEPIFLKTRGRKLFLYEQMRPAPAIVVLGSSRSFTVEAGYIKAKTSRVAFNASAEGAGVSDYLDFARCFAGRGSFPSLLIVAVGVEQALAGLRTGERDDRMDNCVHRRRTLLDQVLLYRGLVTIEETWASLRVLGLEVTGRPAPAYSFGDDGTLRRRETPPPESLPQRIDDSLVRTWSPRRFAGDSLAPESISGIRQLLDLARDHGSKVIIYVPPYHPRAVTRYLKESNFGSVRSQLLEQLAVLASEYPLRFYDFSEASRYGGREEMFSDASHPTADADRLMLDIMLADES